MIVGWLVFFKGVAIGLAVAMPIGPLNILCITRTLQSGFKGSVPVLLGTSLADASYAVVAVLGLTVVSDFLINYQSILRFIGGAVLVYMGVKAFKNKINIKQTSKAKQSGYVKDVLMVYGITMSSPLTIVSFAALFASVGLDSFQASSYEPILLVAGVMAGTLAWMLLLTTISLLVRRKASDGILIKLNRVGGVVLLGFAVALFASLVFGF